MSLTLSTFLEEFDFLQGQQNLNIAVAVSGGADSLALTFLLKAWCDIHNAHLVALTVDHGLRQDSAQEAQDLHALLKFHGIEHHVLRWDGAKPTAALQEKARSKRYDLLENWCHQHSFPYLFLGHHQGDQAETYCMRLRRHSGLLGLACMRAVVKKQRVTLVRPFLNTPKKDLKDFLRTENIPWVEDPSNENTSFERVFWRQFLGDLSLDITPFQKIRKAYEGWLQRFLRSYTVASPLGYCRLQKQPYCSLPQSFQGVLISHLLRAYGTQKYPLTSASLERLLATINAKKFSATTAGGLRISRQQQDFLFVREYRAIKACTPVNHQKILWDKRFLIETTNMPSGTIKAIGERGWLQLLQTSPALKKLEEPRGALWSLPALFVQSDNTETIHPTMNMVYEHFLQSSSSTLQKKFSFHLKSPF